MLGSYERNLEFEYQGLDPSVLKQRIKTIKEQYYKKIEKLKMEMENICSPLEDVLMMKLELLDVDEKLEKFQVKSQVDHPVHFKSKSNKNVINDSKPKSIVPNKQNMFKLKNNSSFKRVIQTDTNFYPKQSRKKSWNKINVTRSPKNRSNKNLLLNKNKAE